MSPEHSDFSSWEYPGNSDFLTTHQADIFIRLLRGESNREIAEARGISINSVKSVRQRINAKIENETGKMPADFMETVMLMAQMGELTYNPKKT